VVCNHVRMMDRSVNYDRPPVRATTLTVYVEPIENFDLSMIFPLYQRWSEKFPASSQSFPRQRPEGVPEVDRLSLASGWPLPAMEQVDNSLSRAVSYQNDQISLRWTFDPEAADTTYPGFDTLSAELNSVFGYFAEIVERLGDKPLKIQGCRCLYVNHLKDIAGVDWLAGYVSDWNNQKVGNRLDDADYVGLRVKQSSENRELGTRVLAMTELDSGEEYGSTRLDIDVVSALLPESNLLEIPPAEAARAMLDDAHARVIETFQVSASNQMRTDWGYRE
jgi:uncharacterized protein (TIGR04255 family)